MVIHDNSVSHQIKPYAMKEEGNFTGFVPDLIEKLAGILQFRYEIHEVADGKSGALDPNTNRWTGMIGEVMRGVSNILQ